MGEFIYGCSIQFISLRDSFCSQPDIYQHGRAICGLFAILMTILSSISIVDCWKIACILSIYFK